MVKKITNATENILKNEEIVISKSKHNEEQMTALGHTAWKYRLQGHSYAEIGKMLGISTTQIKHFIQNLHDEFLLETWQDKDQWCKSVVSQLLYNANETQKLWEEAKRNGDVNPAHVAYLESSRRMYKDIRDIMGLDSPKRTEMQVSTGEQPYSITMTLDGSTK